MTRHRMRACVFFSFRNVEEAATYLRQLQEEDGESDLDADVYIMPPQAGYGSGEDDADEDDGGEMIDVHFTQVNSLVEVQMHGDSDDDDNPEDTGNEENTGPPPKRGCLSSVGSRASRRIAQLEQHSEFTSSMSKLPAASATSVDVKLPPNMPHLHDNYKWVHESGSGAKIPIFPEADYQDCGLLPHELFE